MHDAINSAPADRKFMHAATYSGHPVCCAVGLANVKIMEDEDLPERAERVGKRLLAGLEELRNLPNVGEVRGLGMMAAVELVTDKATKEPAIGIGAKVAREAMARGILLRPRPGALDPAIGDTICLAPPLMTPEVDDRPHRRGRARVDHRRDGVASAPAAVGWAERSEAHRIRVSPRRHEVATIQRGGRAGYAEDAERLGAWRPPYPPCQIPK